MPVYFLQRGSDGPVKIGFATDVKDRVKTLQIASPERLRVIRQIKGNIAVERWLHKNFKKHRLNGEWFSFCDEMLTIEPPVIERPTRKPRDRDFCDKLSAALRKRAERFGGVTEFSKALAASLDIAPSTVGTWLYGQTLPGLAAWVCLCMRFGPLFEIEVLGEGSERIDQREELEELQRLAAELRSRADRIDPMFTGLADLTAALKAKQAPVVPLKARRA